MKSFTQSKTNYFAISRFESYGDLINIVSVFLAIIEFFILGLESAPLIYFIMIILFSLITIGRFFIVLTSHEKKWKNSLAVSFNTTVYSAFLIAVIWGGSYFFFTTNTLYFFFIHILFLLLIAFLFSIFFSSLPVISTLIIILILAPVTFHMFNIPTADTQSLPIAVIFISIGLMVFSFLHGREVLHTYKQITLARKNQLRLHARNNRIKTLEQFIPRPNRNLLAEKIVQSNQMWDIILVLTSGPECEKSWQSCFSSVLPAITNAMKADGVFIATENEGHIDSFRKNNNQEHTYSWIFSIGSLHSKLLHGQTIHSIDSDFPDNQRIILKRENIKGLLLVPIFLEDQFWGVFGLIKSRSKSYFSQQHVNFFYFLTNLLSLNIRSEKNRTEMRRLTTVVEQSDDCIIITDQEGEILYTNPACEQVTGHTPDELTGKDVKKLNRSENREKIWEEIDNALTKGEKWHGQYINKRKDNTLYEEEMIISPVHDLEGKQTNLVIIKRNITEAKRLESIAEAANLMDNIGYIFSSLRHELGNPINSLKVSLSILESNLENYDRDDIKRFLRRNLSDIKRVEYLLTTLKNFSVFEKPRIEPVNMVDVLRQFTTLIKQDIQEKNIKLILNIPKKKIIGLIDPRAFQQVLLNLTTNAIDSLEDTTNKRITITLYQEEKNQINLTIGDNGCGIGEEEQANLFKPFFTTKPQGTGLGLVIVKKMLSKMHCSIDVHSKKSIGTQIFIIVPGAEKSSG